MGQLIKDAHKKAYVVEKIANGGPPHKQLQHTLVLNRLAILTELLSKKSAVNIALTAGRDIILEEHETTLPLQLPLPSMANVKNGDAVMEKMVKGPEHEILYTTLLLQVIEGLINAAQPEAQPGKPVKRSSAKAATKPTVKRAVKSAKKK